MLKLDLKIIIVQGGMDVKRRMIIINIKGGCIGYGRIGTD